MTTQDAQAFIKQLTDEGLSDALSEAIRLRLFSLSDLVDEYKRRHSKRKVLPGDIESQPYLGYSDETNS